MPAVGHGAEAAGGVVGEDGAGVGGPVTDLAAIAAPQDVVAAIAVEVAGAGDLPAGRDGGDAGKSFRLFRLDLLRWQKAPADVANWQCAEMRAGFTVQGGLRGS